MTENKIYPQLNMQDQDQAMSMSPQYNQVNHMPPPIQPVEVKIGLASPPTYSMPLPGYAPSAPQTQVNSNPAPPKLKNADTSIIAARYEKSSKTCCKWVVSIITIICIALGVGLGVGLNNSGSNIKWYDWPIFDRWDDAYMTYDSDSIKEKLKDDGFEAKELLSINHYDYIDCWCNFGTENWYSWSCMYGMQSCSSCDLGYVLRAAHDGNYVCRDGEPCVCYHWSDVTPSPAKYYK